MISAAAEAAFPDQPRFYSLALNAHAANLKQMNEIEAASQLALGLRNGLSLKKAIEEVRASEPQCKASLDAIGFYASHFGGGENMPLIDFLGKFGSSAALHIVIAMQRHPVEESLQWLCKLKLSAAVYTEASRWLSSFYKAFQLCV